MSGTAARHRWASWAARGNSRPPPHLLNLATAQRARRHCLLVSVPHRKLASQVPVYVQQRRKRVGSDEVDPDAYGAGALPNPPVRHNDSAYSLASLGSSSQLSKRGGGSVCSDDSASVLCGSAGLGVHAHCDAMPPPHSARRRRRRALAMALGVGGLVLAVARGGTSSSSCCTAAAGSRSAAGRRHQRRPLQLACHPLEGLAETAEDERVTSSL